MSRTPIAVFTYNRPEHTINMLQSLMDCTRLDECDIYIYSDAPRIPEHTKGVEETRALIRAWGMAHGAQVIQRAENWGLARSIVSGVTELCERYGRIIVVEDDLVLHPAFIHYMLSALDRYENDEKVAQVSGYMFPVNHPEKPEVFLLPLTTTWGWGTWQRAWKDVDWQAENAIKLLKDKNLRRKFDFGNSYPYSEMLRGRLQEKNQSWGILFYWWVFTRGLLVLHPRRSFVYNAGMDGSGYHSSGRSSGYASKERLTVPQDIQSFDFPAQLIIDWKAYHRIRRYIVGLTPSPFKIMYSSIKQKTRNFFGNHA